MRTALPLLDAVIKRRNTTHCTPVRDDPKFHIGQINRQVRLFLILIKKDNFGVL